MKRRESKKGSLRVKQYQEKGNDNSLFSHSIDSD